MKNNAKLVRSLKDNKVDIHCLLNIDEFDLFNARYGTENGNNILSQVSKITQEELNPKQWIYLGNDKFYCSVSSENKSIDKAMDSLLENFNTNLKVIVSIGIVFNRRAPAYEIFQELKWGIFFAKGECQEESSACVF